jgi:hypothetical protein
MYQKIDITVGPTLIQAKLESVSVCSCGKRLITTPVGTRYNADLKSVRWVKFQCFGCGKEQEIRVIDVWSKLCIPYWFPLACLDIDAMISFAPKPANWEVIEGNKVAPAHRLPSVRVN